MKIQEVLFFVFLGNFFYLLVMFIEQCDALQEPKLPDRNSTISGTNQRFLYLQDYCSTSWGSLIGLPFIANAFAHLALKGKLGIGQWAASLALALVSAYFLKLMCLVKNRKPDWICPGEGAISAPGWYFLAYSGLYISMTCIVLFHWISGDLRGFVLYAAKAGMIIYVGALIADCHAGNFDRLKLLYGAESETGKKYMCECGWQGKNPVIAENSPPHCRRCGCAL